MKYLETERLILRDYRADDIADYYRLKSDPRTMFYLDDIRLSSLEEARADLDAVLADRNKEDRKFWFFHMELKDSHKQVGSIGYTVTGTTPRGAVVNAGYFSYPEFWNRGYTTEAMKKLLEYAFTEGGVYLVETGCNVNNVGSERVMRKCGMVRKNGAVPEDRAEYRLDKDEWEKLRL